MTIKDLRPANVWKYFDEICQIPHVSYNPTKICAYFVKTFTEMGYKPILDKGNNVYVAVPATKGYENLPGICLQAHWDMVGVKVSGSNHNFDTDPIKTIIKGDLITADGTTLGADNGIGVAMAMAIASDKTLAHGKLEILITANEETGMEGIQNFDVNKLTSKYLLNLDNEDDDQICIGCPGNIDLDCSLSFQRKKQYEPESSKLKIALSGGLGGHSGQTIGEKRVNAIKKIFDILKAISTKYQISLIQVEKTGVAKNVIPFECTAHIEVLSKDVEAIKKLVNDNFKLLKQEYDKETNLAIACETSNTTELPLLITHSQRIINTFCGVFNGVHTFNWKYSVPESSSNIGLLEMNENTIKGKFMVRSSFDLAMYRIANRISSIFELAGGKAINVGMVSGWLPKPNKFADIYQQFYKDVFKKDAKQVLINGGVEPAFILSKKPDMLGISIGPSMKDIHSPNEQLSISSTQKLFELLCKFLIAIK